MADLRLFEFSDEVIGRIKEESNIPIDFYNKEGQVLIHKKAEASPAEVDRLLKFVEQGIYFDIKDGDKIAPKKRDVPEGLSDTKLIAQEKVDDFVRDTETIFQDLKSQALSSTHTTAAHKRMSAVFQDFEAQPDLMVGLVNILDVLGGGQSGPDVEVAIKRAVVAMAFKVRGIKANTSKDRGLGEDAVMPVMTSALLCQIGKKKMTLPLQAGLSQDEIAYMRQYPLISYLMLAHLEDVDPDVKRSVLTHRRPHQGDEHTNNYPKKKWLISYLAKLAEKYKTQGNAGVTNDIHRQIRLLAKDDSYDENGNILAISTDFAALTSDTSWREAFDPVHACKMIINKSLYSYSDRILREFLDYIAISLCDNKLVIKEGDMLGLNVLDGQGRHHFEVAEVIEVDKNQSRPFVKRHAVLNANPVKVNGHHELQFDFKSVRRDRRFAKYRLSQDYTRRIVQVFDKQVEPKVHGALMASLKD